MSIAWRRIWAQWRLEFPRCQAMNATATCHLPWPCLTLTWPRSVSQPCSPLPLEARLEAAEARRTAIDHLRAANLSERLAKVEAVRSKKEELVVEKAARTKEEMEAKQEKVTEKRQAVVAETREKLSEHLARVERAQRDLEIQTEAYRLSTEFALNAKMMKVEENKDEQLEGMLARIQEHEAYVAKVGHQKYLFVQTGSLS